MQNPAHAIQHLNACILVTTADCGSVLELGCGVGDRLAICQGPDRVGVDVHGKYLKRAHKRWGTRLTLIEANAVEFVQGARGRRDTWDGIMLIDFIEHLTPPDAALVLKYCTGILAKHRVIVFCPVGNCPQEKDTFDMGGEYWQTHRSTWHPEDLTIRGFDVAVWDNPPKQKSMFAIWNQP